jgi:hypothetical protein
MPSELRKIIGMCEIAGYKAIDSSGASKHSPSKGIKVPFFLHFLLSYYCTESTF